MTEKIERNRDGSAIIPQGWYRMTNGLVEDGDYFESRLCTDWVRAEVTVGRAIRHLESGYVIRRIK